MQGLIVENISNLYKILVISSKNPKPDLLLLDKQLSFAEYLKIKPIIVLNKTDLDKKHIKRKNNSIFRKFRSRKININKCNIQKRNNTRRRNKSKK